MTTDPSVENQIKTVLDWNDTYKDLHDDQDFHRNFAVIRATDTMLLLRHWSKTMIEMRLGDGGKILGWKILDPPGSES